MKIIVYWVLITILSIPYKEAKDEFGRNTGKFVIDTLNIRYDYDTLSRTFNSLLSAEFFRDRALQTGREPKHVKTSDSTWTVQWDPILKEKAQWVTKAWITREEE